MTLIQARYVTVSGIAVPQAGAAALEEDQQATDTWGWEPQKLAPLLAALKELLPWLHQWHHAIDPAYGDRISTTYQQFYETELHALRMTDEDIEGIRMGPDKTK